MVKSGLAVWAALLMSASHFVGILPEVTARSPQPDMQHIRTMYYEALHNRQKSEYFVQYMDSITLGKNTVLLGYKAMAYCMQAKHTDNPFTKYSLFSKGKNMLEYAVSRTSDNIELRFLRFCIQTNIPFFLGYSQHIDGDKSMILAQWRKLTDNDLKQRIKDFMLLHCTLEEQAAFQ